jgi:glycerophosphoryl diester phosphodiesterase
MKVLGRFSHKCRGPVVLLAASVFLWGGLLVLLRSDPLERPALICHRGLAGWAPENTLAAMREAISRGAQFAEVDVRRSVDGVIVLMHDETVDRTTDGQGRVDELTWDEISKLDAGSHFSPVFVGEPVPTLDEALALVASSTVTLVLEVKQPSRYPGIALQVADVLGESDLHDRVVVVSFDHDWLNRLGDLMPAARVGYLQVHPGIPRRMYGNGVLDVHWSGVLLDPTLIRRAHRQGHRIWVWTVNDAWLMRLLVWLGVDGITTDHPERYPEALHITNLRAGY